MAILKFLTQLEKGNIEASYDLKKVINQFLLKGKEEYVLEKMLYIAFRHPWILTHPFFDWYPQLFEKVLKRLKASGSYRQRLRKTFQALQEGIKNDKELAKKHGRPPNPKADIIRMVQNYFYKWTTNKFLPSSDYLSHYRARKKFKSKENKVYPAFRTYNIPLNEDGSFRTPKDIYLWNALHWLDRGFTEGYLQLNDIKEIISIFKNETIFISDYKLRRLKNVIKEFLLETLGFNRRFIREINFF
jgi:hypothetical protein